jgi:NAD(P)-dependent dehydrogenase (short-subunit alcohol dehydrogenase family)
LALDVPALAAPMGGVDVVLIAYGTLTDEARAMGDLDYAAAQMQVNFTSQARWCLSAAEILGRQGHGVLLAIGSVAGDRGRGSNALYGSAKAGLATLVQGLAHRLAPSGARAVVIKPGFTDTPMTSHLQKGGPLWATPDQVAEVILKASRRGGPVVYAPGFWRVILWVIRLLPTQLLHKTKL